MWKKPRGYRDPNIRTRIFMDELLEASELETSEEMESAVFQGRTASIRPVLYYSKPLDDVTYFAFNFPYAKFVFV